MIARLGWGIVIWMTLLACEKQAAGEPPLGSGVAPAPEDAAGMRDGGGDPFLLAGLTAAEVQRVLDALKAALREDDPRQVARLVALPIEVSVAGETLTIGNEDDLADAYRVVFNRRVVQEVLGAELNALIVRSDGVGTATGAVWIAALCDTTPERAGAEWRESMRVSCPNPRTRITAINCCVAGVERPQLPGDLSHQE